MLWGQCSAAVVTSGDPADHTVLDVRLQIGPEYTSSFETEVWVLWLALEWLDEQAVTRIVLICSDSLSTLAALKESAPSGHSALVPLRARLEGYEGHVSLQ